MTWSVLTGCGSGDDKSGESSATSSAASSSAETTTAEATETSAAAPADKQTVGEYLTANGVSHTIVKANEPGVPKVDLPMPEGWEPIPDADLPQDAYGAIFLSAAKGTPNPPAVIARMARLEGGEFDVATILELVPNAVTKLDGWQGPLVGEPAELGGFEAVAIAGTALVDGAPTFVARKGVVIEGAEHTYMLALDAQGPVEQQDAILAAMTTIDSGTTITP
ncbi:LpqN/LpqT family lipoprotein [Mycobacterium sp. 236(2023)]|uniref:LpqN/LpqT family lipoprotein n=1 Tax=Mycobacterium sp. 236(2023) TaxID=3038163 RepID=UPI00241531D4|nr:LpqN/LpqT family lipoprotein [Mycobacterium sp. 236(2023)]MDG4663991.1 LpqN/LpqT family lipoprotein [Mycobacterium sp. 236(2023)]